MLSWAMDNFLDKTLDYSITENARYAIVRKILLLMIENSRFDTLSNFFIKYIKILEGTFKDI
jgi:hypothetical protein